MMPCWPFAQVPAKDALLWEVKAPGTAERSYLFGTIHLICEKDFVLSDSLKFALSKSAKLALEVDIDDPGMMGKMMKTMYMAGGQDLKSLVGEAGYAKLSRFFRDSVGLGIDMFAKAKPFVMMGPLFNAILPCEPRSYELTLANLAGEQKSEVIGLETIEEQMAVFDSIPYQEQATMLMSLIDSLPKARKEFATLVSLYKDAKINDLYQAALKSEFGMEGNEELVLFERNQKWIPRIRQMMTAAPTLFAVGAAHLGGEKGIIALLRKEGYTVRAIQ
ncbi:TraB/GumN family protein [Dyadobacter sandarakinus]|uniref:TraB/GumN family protein n=1 Tax=Dyadobacter sandarakinus TaxID=2747268 RepID=A0ABX7IAS0_9BACT|nr:TraB/GumN family protein [Dyadobacter sandarakinus]QRR03204.1 TraB/GumN family protein [Dyadobacter sandarakinus]